MTLTATSAHTFVSPVADQGVPDQFGPADWNGEGAHTVSLVGRASNAQLDQAPANTVLMNNTGSTANLIYATLAQFKTWLALTLSDITTALGFTPANVTHTHAAADVTSGVLAVARLATGTPNGTKFIRDDGVLAVPPGGVSDGDKGDITVTATGATWTIDSNVLSTAGRALVDDATATAQRNTLVLGTADTVQFANVGIGISPANKLHVSGGQARLPDGSTIAGNSPGIAFDSWSDTGIAADTQNICLWESGVIALNLSNLLKEFRVPSDYKYAFSSATNNNAASDVSFSRIAATVLGCSGALQFTEMTAPAAPATNSVRLYAEDNGSGKTRLMALFPTGVAKQIEIET